MKPEQQEKADSQLEDGLRNAKKDHATQMEKSVLNWTMNYKVWKKEMNSATKQQPLLSLH